MSKSSLRQQQLQLQQQQQQQQMMADNEAAALAAEMFDVLCAATTMRQILGLYRNMCDTIGLRPGPINEFYPKLKQKIRSWKAQALWKKFDIRASHRVYNKGNACTGSRVLVIGAGPCGLRAAIEAQLLGAKVCIVEKRDRISRNNVVHLWPFVITDLKNLGAKKFYGKFCAGSIDHISIRQLQCILLKVALLLGVEIHEGVSFLNTIEPSDDCGWRAEVTPTDHAVSHYEFDVLFGADGKRNTLEGFKRKEFRGKLAIAITANFINKKTEAEARAEEISGVAFIFNQSFFKELYQTTGIDLENIVYYKDETHYFVMTAKKHSLIDKNVIIQDFADPAELLSPQNVNTDKLLDYAREAAEFSTKYQMPNLEFAVNHYGKPDVAMFDFTSMFAAEASSRVIVRKNYRLLQCLVGDSLLEPFWPTGSGCARGFLSSMDAAYMIKLHANQRNSILGILAQRESIYRLLAQTTPENLQRDIGAYTVDPATRYPNLNKSIVNVWQVKHLIDTDDPNLLEQVHMDTNALQQTNVEMPIRRKRRTGDLMPLSTVLLRWIKAQLHAHEFSQNLTEASECITNGQILCALINRYRPELIDLNTIKDLKPIECNELAFKIFETELNIPRCISAKQSMSLENVDSKIWLNYLEQICEGFRGEIPQVKHPKLDYFELKEKSSRDKKPDFSHLLNRTTKTKAKSPMQDIDLTANVHRRSILDEDKARRQRKNAGNGIESTVLSTGHGDTSRRAKKRRSQEKTTNIEERQQRLKEIEANRLERQSKRKQQRYQQTQNFYKSLQMLQAQNLFREDGNDEPFEDYSIYMYRQNAPEFNDRVKMLEKKLLHPDRDRGIQSAFPRSNDENFSNRIKSMEQQITSRTTSGTDKKPKDLLRAIGKIDSNDWNIREIEKKIEQSKKTEIPGKSKEKVPKWSKEQFLARQNKMSKPPLEREESTEEKFKEIDQTLKNLDKQLKEGSIREIGERGKNKVASIAGQFGKKDDTSDEKPVPQQTTKSSSKVSSVFKNQSASEKCHFCKQTVYLMEKIATENLILHRSCLKCHHCHTNLRLGAYAFDRDDPVGRFYCTQHFRLPAKAIRPMGRKSTKQQKKSTAAVLQSTEGGDSKTTDQLVRGRPDTIAQLDLLDRGQTPERIEFENADAMSDGEPSLENIIDENEWTDRNFVTDSDDSESDLSSSDESDDESESFEDADDGSPIAQTLQLATDWIGKQRYSNGGSEDSDNDFYDSSDGMLDENDADSQTEGEEFKKAREMRRQEVKLLPIPTNLPTDTETEVKSKDAVQSNDHNNSNPIYNSNNNNKNSNENLINNSISMCSSDNNMNTIPFIPSKTEIKIIERDLGRPISTEIDSLNENIFNLNNFLKLNKEVDNLRKENLVKNDIMKKLSLKEKWLNESNTGASNLSLDKITEHSEIKAIAEEQTDRKDEIVKEITETEKVSLEETKLEINSKVEENQTDFNIGVDINYKANNTESNENNSPGNNTENIESKSNNTEPNKNNNSANNTEHIEKIESQSPKTADNNENVIESEKKICDEVLPIDNKMNEIIKSIKAVSIEKVFIDERHDNAENLSKSVENLDLGALKTKQKSDGADMGQLLYDVENKCSPKVQRRKMSNALKKIEARSFADTKGVIESQITGPKMSKQSSLDLSRYFPNQKQEKTSTVAANKNQKTLKDVDLNQYFAQSPIPQRKISVQTKSPAALRKCNTEKIIPALYKPTIKEKMAVEGTQNIPQIPGASVNSTPGPSFQKPDAKINQLHYTPTMKEILASGPLAIEIKSTEPSSVIDSKPKPNILHYKPTMKEILAAHADSPKLDTLNRPIPPKRQKAKETGSSESLNKRKTKDSDFDIYDQQVDGSVDLKKKIGNSVLKTDEKSTTSSKKKIVKKVVKKSTSALITADSSKLVKKKSDNISPTIKKKSLNYEDEILNEILNTDDDEIRSPSIEYQKLFQEEKSPSEDISDRIENILIETGIDLGLPRRSSINRKKLLKARSLGEDEFINKKNQLSSYEANVKEEGDEPQGFQDILKRFESLSSVKNFDNKTGENKLKDSNENNASYERRYSRDSIKSKKSSSDEFSDLERTLEYLKSEWKTEATNFLQKKRSSFFSKPKSIDEVREQIEEDKEELKRNTEQYFEEMKNEAKVKYHKTKISKEKSPKRKISDNGNNKVKEIKIQQEKQPIKRKKSAEKNIDTNTKELTIIQNSNDSKINLKTIGRVKSFEKFDSELDDMDVEDIFNEIVNELHINDDKLGTPDIQEYLPSSEKSFELNKGRNSSTEKQNSSSEICKEGTDVCNSSTEKQNSSSEICKQGKDICNSSTEKQNSSSEICKEESGKSPISEKIRELKTPVDFKVVSSYKKKSDSSPIKMETEKDKLLVRKSSSPKVSLLESFSKNNYIESNDEIDELNKSLDGSKKYISNKEENNSKNKIKLGTPSRKSSYPEVSKLQSPENIKSTEDVSESNRSIHDCNIHLANNVIDESPIEFEISKDNYEQRNSNLTKSLSPKANNLESEDDCKIYALNKEINESNMKFQILRKNSLDKNNNSEGCDSPKLNSPKAVSQSENISPVTTKRSISVQKMLGVNGSKSSTEEDSIEQLFNQFTDDMLVDVEFDSNDELISITPRAIVKKAEEGRDENFEITSTESPIPKSVEEQPSDVQFPMKPPRRQKTGSSSTSPDIPSIPIRAKHIANNSKEIPPSVQDIMMKSLPNNDDDSSYIIPINISKPVRFPSRYEEEEDFTMANISLLKINEFDDEISAEVSESAASELESIKEKEIFKLSKNSYSGVNYSRAEDNSEAIAIKHNEDDNILILSENFEMELKPDTDNVNAKASENTNSDFVDSSLNSKNNFEVISTSTPKPNNSENISIIDETTHSPLNMYVSHWKSPEKENTVYLRGDRCSSCADKNTDPLTCVQQSDELADAYNISNDRTVISIKDTVQIEIPDKSLPIDKSSVYLSNFEKKSNEYVSCNDISTLNEPFVTPDKRHIELREGTTSNASIKSQQDIFDGTKVTNVNECVVDAEIVKENTSLPVQPSDNTYPPIQECFASSENGLNLISPQLTINDSHVNKAASQIVETGEKNRKVIERPEKERWTALKKRDEIYLDGNKSTSEEDWAIIERLEKERLTALRKRDQMYFKANNSSSLVERPRIQTEISSSDSFESALSRSIPEISVIPKSLTPPPIPPLRSPKPTSKMTRRANSDEKSLPIEVIEHSLPTIDRAYSPSSTQSKNSSHSLTHSIESIPNRPQRQKSNPAENIPVDYGTRILLERSQMLRDRKKDFMDDKMVGNNPYMKKMISTERKHRVSSDDDDDVEFPDSYRPSNLNTRNINYSRFPTSRAIQDRQHYNSAISSSMDRYGMGTSTSSRYSTRLSPLSTRFGSPSSSSSRHLTDYFKRSPSNSKEHHYHQHHARDQSKDACVQSDSESSSADDDVNSATEISTDSEFDHDPVIRETPKIFIDDTHLRKPTKVQIKQVIIGNNGTNHPPKLQNVTNTKLTSSALQNALTHQELEFKPLVQVDPSLLNSNRIMPLKNPRSGDYLLNKTASTEGIACKTSLELKKRYLLGGEQPGIGNKIMKSGSTSILDTKLKSFHSNISECQKRLNAASDISVGMRSFLDRTTKLSSNDIIGMEKKKSETEMKLKKDLEEKENVFVNSKNELNKGMEYSETVNTALIEHITKNPKTIQLIKLPSPIIETIDLISPEKEVPNRDLKQPEFNKCVQIIKNEKNTEIDDSIEIIDLTYSPPMKILEKTNDVVERINLSKNNKQPIPDIIKQAENIKFELPDQSITQVSKTADSSPITVIKTEELDNECQDTCIQVPQIPWPTKKTSKDDVESDSLSTSSSTSSLEDIPHYILESTTSPDTQNCGNGGIVPRLEIHDSSGALMQIDSLMIIDGKYIGDPEDLPLMEIPEGMTTSTPTITEATTIVGVTESMIVEPLCDKSFVSKQSNNKNNNQIPIVSSTKDLKFDSKNENKIESLKNLPLIYDKSNEDKKPKPQSLDLGNNTVLQTLSADTKLSPTTPTPAAFTSDNDKTPTANDNNHHTDSETEQTGQLLTETELSDWTADDAVSENFVDIEFVLNSNKGTIKRNKKGKKGKLNSKSGNIQIKNTLRKEKCSPTVQTPREGGGILENLAIGEIDFMDTGSEGSCAETYDATNNALIKNRGYIEFIENTAHNEYSPTTTGNNFNVINLRQSPKTNFSVDTKSYKRSNSAKEILGIDYIEQGACILNSNVNNSEIDLKTPVNEVSPPIFSIGKPVFFAVDSTINQLSPKLQLQQPQSLTDSTNELDDDSLVMMTSQSGTNTNTTTTTEESEALTVVTSPLDSSSPRTQGNLITTPTSSSTATSSVGDINKIKDVNKTLSSNSNNKTPSKCSNEQQHIISSNRKRSSQEDLLNSTKRKDSDEMSYEEYVRKLQQKITQISNAKDSIDVRKHKRKTSRCSGGGELSVVTISELERTEHDEMDIKSQTTKSIGSDTKGLSIFESSQQPVSLITNNSTKQENAINQHIHKVPEIPTLSSKLEEITKERTKQKDLIHDLVMDKLQSKKQLNAEKRLNRNRNRSSIFSPRNGINDNNLMISSTPKLVLSSNNGCTNNYNLTKSASEQIQNFKENIPNKKKNSSPSENKDIIDMFHQANVINRKSRPLSDNLDKIAINYHNYEQSQSNSGTTGILHNSQSKHANDLTQYVTPKTTTVIRSNHNFDETRLAANTGKLKAEARARARLKTNQDLGLSPEEKLQILRKRYHLDLRDVINVKNTTEELRARQRKMITSKSVNDISLVQQQQPLHLLTSDENFNTTKSNTNIDFTSDPNLSNSINCNSKPDKLSRRHKDPERRKSLIQTFSSFFNKGKKDKDTTTATLCETSPTKDKEYKQSVEAAAVGVFSRFRISPKAKDKSKEKDETPPFEQCNLTQDCLKHEFSSTPHLFNNNNKNIDDTALIAAASGALIAVTATPGIVRTVESIIDNYEDNDDDDDDEEPPPIPPLPLNYQRSDDESYTTAETREYQKKQRAISKASRQAELKRIRIAQEIQREQEEIEVQLKEYEARGVIIEKALRGEGQNIENLETSSMGASDEKLLKELLEIWRNITQLKKRDEELGIRQQELKLEHRHAQLKDELNMRLSCGKLDKSSADVAAEGAILNEMLEIVAKRAALRPNEQSTSAGSYVSSINRQSTSNESEQI